MLSSAHTVWLVIGSSIASYDSFLNFDPACLVTMLQEFKTSLNRKNLELCLFHNKDEKSKSVNYLLLRPVTHSLNKYLSTLMTCFIFFSNSVLRKIPGI